MLDSGVLFLCEEKLTDPCSVMHMFPYPKCNEIHSFNPI